MKAILVHVHIYYVDMWEELKGCLKNIGDMPYDLYISIVAENASLERDILDFNPDAKIDIVENRGFDVAPFVNIINSVNLDDYEYIIKLHTKRNMPKNALFNGFNLGEDRWRKASLDFIATKENFSKTLELLKNRKVGMVSNYKLVLINKGYDKASKKNLVNFLKDKNFPNLSFRFAAGTMFIAKANIFKPLQNMFSLNDFEKELKPNGQLAHLIERFLGYLVYYNKQVIHFTFFEKVKVVGVYVLGFFWQNKITTSGYRIIKICKIPVYHRKIKK